MSEQRKRWIERAKKELREGASEIDVIGILEDYGCSSLEAEEIVEVAHTDLREEP